MNPRAFLIAILILVPLVCPADLRMDERSSSHVEAIMNGVDDWEYYYWNMTERPSYLPGYPEVIERVLLRERTQGPQGDSGWLDKPTIELNPVVIDGPQGRTIHYNSLSNSFRRSEVYDAAGRLTSFIHLGTGDGGEYGTRNYFYYNQANLVDSIYVSQVNTWGSNSYTKYLTTYDQSGKKIDEICYQSADSLLWEPLYFSMFYHRDQCLPEGFEYRLHHLMYQIRHYPYPHTYPGIYHSGLYGRAMVDSVRVQSFGPEGWQDHSVEYYQYNMYEDYFYVGISVWDYEYIGEPFYKPGYYSIGFDNSGYLFGHHWIIDDGFGPPTWGGVSYSWELPVVANDPQLVPQGLITDFRAYPNPFNPQAEITFDLDHESPVRLDIYNLRGQIVAQRELGTMSKGRHNWTLDTNDLDGRALSSGVYLLKLSAGAASRSIKISLIK